MRHGASRPDRRVTASLGKTLGRQDMGNTLDHGGQGLPGQGKARDSNARHGNARHVNARNGNAINGNERHDNARQEFKHSE